MSSKRTSNKAEFLSTNNNRFGASSMQSGDYNPVMQNQHQFASPSKGLRTDPAEKSGQHEKMQAAMRGTKQKMYTALNRDAANSSA